MAFQYHQNFQDGLFGKYQQALARIPSDSSILEVGCHTGYFSRVLIVSKFMGSLHWSR